MMRHLLRSSLLVLASLAAAAGSASAQAKLGYVNTQAVLAQTPSRSTAEEAFNKQMAPYGAEMQRMDSTLKVMIDAFNRDSTVAAAQRQTRAGEIQTRQAQYQARAEAIEDSAQAIRARLMQPLMAQLERALEEVRKEGGYALIFDLASGASIVAADTTLDVTPRVIAKMKAMPAPTAATATPATGPLTRPAGVTNPPRRSPPRR